MLVQSGGVDQLVPYACSKPLLDFLKVIAGKNGWFEDGESLIIDDRVYDGVGHRFTDEMMNDAVKWISESVARSNRGRKPVWLIDGNGKSASVIPHS